MSGVILNNVKKRYGAVEVIKGVDITIDEGEFCVFVGPSGCGKSTLLRMIAGLEEITSGEVQIGGRRVNDLDPADRGAAMVFQTYALYPHMTVERNMGFGLLMNGMPKAEVKKRTDEAARILQLEPYLQRKPKALSGGQRQRVAIGRAIVRDPEVFLFDEPLSNLDAELRVATRLEIAKLHNSMERATMIYVTHDQVEAMTLADKIVVLRDGRVEQIGAPMDLYERPDNLFVAGFIGSPKMNFIELTPDGEAAKMPDGRTVSLPGVGHARTLGVRADALKPTSDEGDLVGTVTVVEQLGDSVLVHFRTDWGQEMVARFDPGSTARVGEPIRFTFAGRTHLFDANGKAQAAAPHPVPA
ncbi:ABC transporter ATP-binding protein [Pelagovum pacificum]|uniref:sn-glycerol-3-phosphate ABC transporter ATP-binding protein UgpC n=1 Tax=Pelagovum pacificum TaxID=2588711 RepID=A0A5C5GHM5_9RHOB|nr:sn-glycerol-3-phosphate ABC transporter ATP-binding protein UgpC [Pelagovum pacificum]QQA42646.1 sn-glycerol-3-phosphate ABC transporter ATP-binding protein UgpC [Pelagovum pacificum]TNY34203.1 sn-glycerol-3-phosphate ABC transporter ATP-binding protein UgpC [Pelagovum pacificum]